MPPHPEHSLPDALFSADGVRAVDRYVIEKQGVDGFELMQKAAHAAFRCLVQHWPQRGPVLVLCGAGNNGGDGYLVAAHAKRHGLPVCCLAVSPTERLAGDARQAWQRALSDGVDVQELGALAEADLDDSFGGAGVIVDAMLGTGVTGAPRVPFAGMIARCNAARAPVLALDLPSGLNATTGAAEGEAVQASRTVTFIGLKSGLYTAMGPALCGDIVYESLGVEQALRDSGQRPVARRLDWPTAMAWLPARPANAHKGRFGHVLVVAGDRGFGGAGLLAAEAAARSGAGLVSLATRPEHVTAALARCPSVMAHGVIHGSELTSLLAAATVVVCGPGIGQNAWGQQMLEQVLLSGKPRVLDADALNLMARRVPARAEAQVLTPHPGEAARMLGCSVADIETDRLAAAKRLQLSYGGVVLLKGAGTVIAAGGDAVDIVSGSNPGMATGGMGDVLSGMVAALYGQWLDPEVAAGAAAAAHLAAANRASETRGFISLLPNDVIDALPSVFRESEADTWVVREDR